ncbi:MAG TPA: hypothetical protein VFT43_13675 [Candidatus Polarisedimenticolia bacterium]|nr:hypothetical protein [Candidatus Polarisedimenticolia bacterium]
MLRQCLHLAPRTLVFLGALALAACQSSDVIAPDGSTISMNATPGTIVLSGGVQVAPVVIQATVSNSLGVYLPGQDVRFSTTIGELDPPPGTPVSTDKFGNATTTLTNATQAPTITARSGKTSATLQVQTATCNLSSVSLNPSPLTLGSCSDTFTLTAHAEDGSGKACVGVLVQFAFLPTSTPTTDVTGTFNPGTKSTDTNGDVVSILDINDNDCQSKCANTKICTGQVQASVGTTKSTAVTITDTVQ